MVTKRIGSGRRPSAVLLVAALVAPALTGCGYHLGVRAPDNVYTIAVPTFDNRTFPLRREIEYDLTTALRKEIQSRTRLTVTSSDAADLVVYGTVLRFDEFVVAEGRLDEKLESTILITVHLRIENFRDRTVREETVRDSEPLSVARGETIDVARRRAIDNLAEKILLKLESW